MWIACLVKFLILLRAVQDRSADYLLREGATHNLLHGCMLLVISQVLIYQILQA